MEIIDNFIPEDEFNIIYKTMYEEEYAKVIRNTYVYPKNNYWYHHEQKIPNIDINVNCFCIVQSTITHKSKDFINVMLIIIPLWCLSPT